MQRARGIAQAKQDHVQQLGVRTVACIGKLTHDPPETGRAVLRRAVELGVNLTDTADFYVGVR